MKRDRMTADLSRNATAGKRKTALHVRYKSCSFCGGDLIRERDTGDYSCLQCGRQQAARKERQSAKSKSPPNQVAPRTPLVGELMKRHPDRVQNSDSVREAVRLMQLHGIRNIPVCDGDTFVGEVSEHDILVGCVALGLLPDACTVGECLSKEPVSVSPDTSLDRAQQLMSQRGRKHLCVTEEGRLVGILSAQRRSKHRPAD